MPRALILYSTEEAPVLKEIHNSHALLMMRKGRPLAKLFTCTKDSFETGLLSPFASRAHEKFVAQHARLLKRTRLAVSEAIEAFITK